MRLRLPTCLRKVLLACLAPVLSFSPVSWSAAFLPIGALCLFATAQPARAEDKEIWEGDWLITGDSYGPEGEPHMYFVPNVDDFWFDAKGTSGSMKSIFLTIDSSTKLHDIHVADGTYLTLSSYAGEAVPSTPGNTFSYSGTLYLDGTIEIRANRASEYGWTDHVFNRRPSVSPDSLGIHKVVTGDNARVVLNFSASNGNRSSYINGGDTYSSTVPYPGPADYEGLADVFDPNVERPYDGVIELRAHTYGIGNWGQNPLPEDRDNPKKWATIHVKSGGSLGAQLQIGVINEWGPNEATDGSHSVPRVYYGDVVLDGETTSSNLSVSVQLRGGKDIAPLFGALRMTVNSHLYGSLTLVNDSNMCAYAFEGGGGALQENGSCYLDGEIKGVSHGKAGEVTTRHKFTVAGRAVLNFSKGGEVGVLMLSNAERSSISSANPGNFNARSAARQTGNVELSTDCKLEISSLSDYENDGSTRVAALYGEGELVIRSGYGGGEGTKLPSYNDAIFRGSFGNYNTGTKLTLEIKGVGAKQQGTKHFSQRMSGTVYVSDLTIRGGILELESRAGFDGNLSAPGESFAENKYIYNSLILDEKIDPKTNLSTVTSELWVHGRSKLDFRGLLNAEGGGRVVVGGVGTSSDDPEYQYRAYLIMRSGASNWGDYRFNGAIEVGEWGVLQIGGSSDADRPKNGLYIEVTDPTAQVWGTEANEPNWPNGGNFVLRNLGGDNKDETKREWDKLNLTHKAARFPVTMRDGGELMNADKYLGVVTVEGGSPEEKNIYRMGGFGAAGSGIILGAEAQGRSMVQQGDHINHIVDLGGLKIMNHAELDFSKANSMWDGKGEFNANDGNEIFNFRDSASGELEFGVSGTLVGSLKLTFAETLVGRNGEDMWYHISNKSITGWKSKVQTSYYDAILRGVGVDFREDGWLRVTLTMTDKNIYVSTRDNTENGEGMDWGWNRSGNVYESTTGARAICVDKRTNFDLRGGERGSNEEHEYKRGLVLPNLVGKREGNLVITGDKANYNNPAKRSLVTISNRIDEGEMETVSKATGIKVNPDLYYSGSINITDADLAIRHVETRKEEWEAGEFDLMPAQGDSKTIITSMGTLNLSGGALLMQSGVLEVQGSAMLGDEGISFDEKRTSQLQISGGSVEAGGTIQNVGTEWADESTWGKTLYEGEEHILLSGDSKLTLRGGTTVKDGILIGNLSEQPWDKSGEGEEKTRQLAGTVSVKGNVSMEKGVSLQNVALNLQDGSSVLKADAGGGEAAEWLLSGLSGGGRLEAEKDISFSLSGHDHIFTGDLASYSGTMTIGDGGKYIQRFDGVVATKEWNVTAGAGSRVEFCLSNGGNTLKMGTVTLEEGSHSAFLLDLDADTLKSGSDKGFSFQEFIVKGTKAGGFSLEVGQDNGSAGLKESGKDRVKQYVGKIEGYAGGDVNYTENAGARLRNVFNVKNASIHIYENGEIYIEGDLDKTNKYKPLANGANATAGANLFGPIFGNTQGIILKGDIGDVMQALNNMFGLNNLNEQPRKSAAGNKLLSAVAGASTSVLAPALGADMQRNLRGIRNRTTSMGMDDHYEYEHLSHTSFWVNAETSYIKRNGEDLLPGYESNAYGGTLGIAHNISTRSTVGLALSAMYQNVTSDAVDHMDADLTTAYINAFAVTQRRSWRHTFIASVGFTNAKMNRRVNWTDEDVAKGYGTSGSTNGTSFGLMYELGYAFAMNADQTTVLQPVFNLQWHNASLSSYEEEGSTAGLRVDPGSYSVVELGLGARMQMVVGESVYNRASLLEMRALVKFYAGDEKGESNVGLQADTSGYSTGVVSASEGRVGIEIGAGLSIPLENRAEFFLDAGAELRSSFFDFNATVGFKFNF